MALYVSVCLLAALTGLPDQTDRHLLGVLGIVWGTTIGLALAHLFAFRLSARLVESGELRREDRELAFAQLVGATAIGRSCVRSRSSSFLHLQSWTQFGSCSRPSSPSSRMQLFGAVQATTAADCERSPTRAWCCSSRSRLRPRRTCSAVTEGTGHALDPVIQADRVGDGRHHRVRHETQDASQLQPDETSFLTDRRSKKSEIIGFWLANRLARPPTSRR